MAWPKKKAAGGDWEWFVDPASVCNAEGTEYPTLEYPSLEVVLHRVSAEKKAIKHIVPMTPHTVIVVSGRYAKGSAVPELSIAEQVKAAVAEQLAAKSSPLGAREDGQG